MSPEQESSSSYLKPASDIYALGVILFEMLSQRNYKNLRPGTRLSTFNPELPDWVDPVVEAMLNEDPRQRPWDGKETGEMITRGREERISQEKFTREQKEQAERQVHEKARQRQEEELRQQTEQKRRLDAEQKRQEEINVRVQSLTARYDQAVKLQSWDEALRLANEWCSLVPKSMEAKSAAQFALGKIEQVEELREKQKQQAEQEKQTRLNRIQEIKVKVDQAMAFGRWNEVIQLTQEWSALAPGDPQAAGAANLARGQLDQRRTARPPAYTSHPAEAIPPKTEKAAPKPSIRRWIGYIAAGIMVLYVVTRLFPGSTSQPPANGSYPTSQARNQAPATQSESTLPTAAPSKTPLACNLERGSTTLNVPILASDMGLTTNPVTFGFNLRQQSVATGNIHPDFTLQIAVGLFQGQLGEIDLLPIGSLYNYGTVPLDSILAFTDDSQKWYYPTCNGICLDVGNSIVLKTYDGDWAKIRFTQYGGFGNSTPFTLSMSFEWVVQSSFCPDFSGTPVDKGSFTIPIYR
jgi:hypothetical protein